MRSAKCIFFYFIYSGTARYFVNALSVPFLIISSITGAVIVLRCNSFLISISRISFIHLLYSLTGMLSSDGTDITIRTHVFFPSRLVLLNTPTAPLQRG